ncbi:phosphonate C-P lyase system protein PhnG [Leptothoe spongobia]|uniref:Phosphonate C-P lyase system protein PhnG n=1 Tax=Leptothoe spongobia TAU-MAC 1115 TaxID=1967444 RepID=A0A947DCT8_9CYAN|nr:phosphonate C-P lyase system protein PhnG [Leptothoe spongobia]MBT9314692.1 phosphonate C-P lyase system protein PhnG [Leptothoe spongobia TAU-MAC 1115]
MVKAEQQPSRAIWMSTLAKAPLPLLEQCVATLEDLPDYGFLRSPEIGLTMVRGRAEGTGQPFNLGEMTLTRCVVQLDQLTGFGYVVGRSKRHAELAALCDGLLQHPGWHAQVQTNVIHPLQTAAQDQRHSEVAAVESTRVNFFTMLRGES